MAYKEIGEKIPKWGTKTVKEFYIDDEHGIPTEERVKEDLYR